MMTMTLARRKAGSAHHRPSLSRADRDNAELKQCSAACYLNTGYYFILLRLMPGLNPWMLLFRKTRFPGLSPWLAPVRIHCCDDYITPLATRKANHTRITTTDVLKGARQSNQPRHGIHFA
jgi:hypothetical protein